MTLPLRCAASLLGILLAGAQQAAAQGSGEARILRVTATTEVAVAEMATDNLGGVRLTKFVEDSREAPQAVLVVAWRAPRSGLPAGAIVRLDYRRDNAPDLRTKDLRVDEPVTGERVTRFSLPLPADGAGRISAWRVQVLHGGRVLDEKTSASWR